MKTWNDIEQLLEGYPRVKTHLVYKDDQPLDTIECIWAKEYDESVPDEQIISDLHFRVEEATKQDHLMLHVRVFPEIFPHAGKKQAYFRLLLVEKEPQTRVCV